MHDVRVTGAAATSAFGRGLDALCAGVFAGRPAFRPVDRFPVDERRVKVGATLPDAADLATELTAVIGAACDRAGLDAVARARTPLLLAVHESPGLGRHAVPRPAGAYAAQVAEACGLAAAARAYTSACVAGTSALADAAAMIRAGHADRVVVAAGYLLESDQFALFDAGRALAKDGVVRPFSTGRTGMVLGDALAALVVESTSVAERAEPLGFIEGWGRAGDAYHVCQPKPDGDGLARAIEAALRRACLAPEHVGYVNAHGTGTPASDAAEAAALSRVFGAVRPPVSSTKSMLGHALEASGLLEIVITLAVLAEGRAPVNANYLGPDDDCDLDVVLDEPRTIAGRHALSINTAFGGANTAILVVGP